MIHVEHTIIDGVDFTLTYSDANRYIVRDGISYIDALDPAIFGRTYTEGDLIPDDEQPESPTAEDILSVLLGEEGGTP